MERNEALKRTDHYRCRLCGQISPITETLCTRPTCQAKLCLYGEYISAEEHVIIVDPRRPEDEETEVKTNQKTHVPKGKNSCKDKKQNKIRFDPASSQTEKSFIQSKKTVKVISLILSALMIVLLLVARNELLQAVQSSDNWRAKYWAGDAQNCLYAIIPVFVSIPFMLLFCNNKSARPIANVISFLVNAVMVGWFMYIWEGARCDSLSVTFCSMCVLAVLNCALWLNTISLKWPILYLVVGILLGAWGIFELWIGESIFFDESFTILFLEVGVLLVLTAVRNIRTQR